MDFDKLHAAWEFQRSEDPRYWEDEELTEEEIEARADARAARYWEEYNDT